MMIPSVAGARALIIDDWEPGARTVQDALARDDIVASIARGDAEARTLTASVHFDLIVVSLALAQEDPLKLISTLRAADATHGTPLLLIAEPEERARTLRGFEL